MKTDTIFLLMVFGLRFVHCRKYRYRPGVVTVNGESGNNGNDAFVPETRDYNTDNCNQNVYVYDQWPVKYFQSPNYPRDYPPDQRCFYWLSSPAGTRIQVDCYDFNIEMSANPEVCEFDKFKFSADGDLTSPKRQYSCGKGEIHQISDSNVFAVLLETDSSNVRSSSRFGFECSATLVKSATTTTPKTTSTTTRSTTVGITSTTTRTPTVRTTSTTTPSPTVRTTSTTTRSPTVRTTSTAPIPTVTITSTTTRSSTVKSTSTTIASPTVEIPPFSTTCKCGQVLKKEPRIVNGADAGIAQYPWRCLLQQKGLGFCGCAVISPNWVLTAAHCALSAEGTKEQLNAFAEEQEKGGSLEVNIGDYDLDQLYEVSNTIIQVDKIIKHEHYNTSTQDNDLSLLHLSRPVAFAENIQPVCLPFKYAGYNFNGVTVVATGWGLDRYGGKQIKKLQKVDLQIYETENCRNGKEFPDFDQPGLVTDNMFCTYEVGRDMCQGDSGGGIDYYDWTTGRYFEVGISSWGIGCADRGRPGAYAKLTLQKYLDWIYKNVGKELCVAA